ncbi:hypothetical protein NMG60_11001842 [Bertholletia excelsa]
MKLKTLIHPLFFSYLRRLVRSLSKAKSFLIDPIKKSKSKNKNKNKLFFGSFRLHYNWCSSHVVPVPSPVLEEHLYYDSTWNSVISTECEDMGDSGLSGYLQWLEEKKVHRHESSTDNNEDINEIDKLADMFIANCHEKFMLEKQESYRRFQEMLARSV